MAKKNKKNKKTTETTNTFVDANGDGRDDRTGMTKEGFVGTKDDSTIRGETLSQVDDSLSQGKRFQDLLDTSKVSPVEKAEQLKADQLSTARSQEMSDLLAKQRGLADEGNKRSDIEEESLGALREGMKGYDSKEVQAMREAANAESDRNTKTAQYQQAVRAARAGVSGGAALAGSQDLDIANMQNKQNTERDLVIQNAQEQQARRQAYADLVTNTEAARWGRTSNLQGLYGNQLAGSDTLSQNAALANQAANLQAGQFNTTTDQARQQFNNQQATNEAMTRANLGLQGAGVYTGQLNSNQANNIANQNLNYQTQANQRYMDFVSQQNAKNLAAQKEIARITGSNDSTVNYNYNMGTGGGNSVGTGSATSGATSNRMATTGNSGMSTMDSGSSSDMAADKLNRSMGYTQVANKKTNQLSRAY